MKRQDSLQAIRDKPEVSVLVIGGGVNGIGTFRDLALQGVDALLVERADFGSGASAASSHMLHGGLRYLENGEFRLVNEALHERDRLLANAPHYAKPLRTTIPIFRWFSGLLNAPLKFAGLLDRPGERGALAVKFGLTFYDFLIRKRRVMPAHAFRLRGAALQQYPALNPEIVCAATYYDAWMPYPERICVEMVLDAEASKAKCRALNYVGAVHGEGDTVTLRDELTGEAFSVKPKVVVNAAGPWIDFVNEELGQGHNRFIGGTKGSHLILDHPALLEATRGSEFYFENDDGRLALILPFFDRVMIGTTDTRIDNPDEAVTTDAEVDYLLAMVNKVFPTVRLERSHIVFTFSGVRPLPYSEGRQTGQISRDHSIRTIAPTADRHFPIHSLIGGKWTTFRAFAEQISDVVLSDLGLCRRVSTAEVPIGGGRAYPRGDLARDKWLRELESDCGLPLERLRQLFERYGTRAAAIAGHIGCGCDRPLAHHTSYSRRELEFILREEKVERLDDLPLRRSLIAMRGGSTRELLRELAEIAAETLGWSDARMQQEIARAEEILRRRHRVDLTSPGLAQADGRPARGHHEHAAV
ncbi:MAG: glycerol-3-phosphate dehydrogenase/oxidase [Chloroflexi bacterium]|nr:glycerol-3-phosphate dehydrogenase/oxidase [Chloroflexota bacterium]